MCQFGEELVELLLALIKLTTADKVDTKQSHDAVNDEETVLIADKVLGDLVEEFHLMLGVGGTSVRDVLLS
jgi:hypothetical protein